MQSSNVQQLMTDAQAECCGGEAWCFEDDADFWRRGAHGVASTQRQQLVDIREEEVPY